MDPAWKSLKQEMKMRMEGVRNGNADWKDARLGFRFYQGSRAVGPWPEIFPRFRDEAVAGVFPHL